MRAMMQQLGKGEMPGMGGGMPGMGELFGQKIPAGLRDYQKGSQKKKTKKIKKKKGFGDL